MMTPRQVLDLARRKKFAIPAFNVSTLEQVRVIVETAQRLRALVIIETSEGESSLMTYAEAAAIVATWRKTAKLPLIINSDHHHSFSAIKQAIMAGYSYVHIDASKFPLPQNIKLTKQVVTLAHAKGVLVEGELGAIGGSSERHREKVQFSSSSLTDPAEAAAFVKATKIDVLAANVGNVHGLWSGGKPKLVIPHIASMRRRLPKTFLTLHGGSGIPDAQVRAAIRAGITKVNVNTELRVAFIGGLRQALKQQPQETTPYKIYPTAMAAMAKVVEQKIRLYGSGGRL